MHATAVQGGVKLLRQLTLTRGDADAIAAGAPGLLALLNDEGQVTGGGQLTHHVPSLQQGRAVHAGNCTILHCALLMACTQRAPELSTFKLWGHAYPEQCFQLLPHPGGVSLCTAVTQRLAA